MRARSWVVTVAAGLVLADASIVTLALPELLRALDTTVEGVAAVIAVYTGVLALALLPAERVVRRLGRGARRGARLRAVRARVGRLRGGGHAAGAAGGARDPGARRARSRSSRRSS